MKHFIIIALFAPVFLTAQTTITWKGGTSGKESAWNEPRNWDAHRLPNENDRVIIKLENNGHFSQPILDTEAYVAWVEIHSGASLTIACEGLLIVDGGYTYSEGISIYGGRLEVVGNIIFKDIESEFIAKLAPICLQNTVTYYSELYDYEFSVVNSH